MNSAVDKQLHAPSDARKTHASRRNNRQRLLIGAGSALVALGVVALSLYWATTGRYLETTEDAYVRADWVAISPRVTGYVAEVVVQDDQRVKAGDVLVRLENRDYQAMSDQARAAVQQAQAALDAAQAAHNVALGRIEQQQQAIFQAQATIRGASAERQRSDLDERRYHGLVKDNAATQQRMELAKANSSQANAALQGAQARLGEQQALLTVVRAQAQLANAQVQHQQAAIASAVAQQSLADQNNADTVIRAPIDGVVGQRRVRAGQYVVPGQPMLAVVPVQQTYVVANYKETQLERMRPGQPVDISIDSFSGQKLKGHVASFSPGSGNVFALLPSDNATGNFTKIVQRFPVRILLDQSSDSGRVLPGMSVVTTVDTHD